MKASFQNFNLFSSFLGNKAWKADETRKNWNNHKITVVNRDNGQRTSFEFWGSIVDPEIDTKEKLVYAFQCFVSDSLAGLQTFEDFCGDFGYDEGSRKAEKVWKACKRAEAKLTRIFDGDLYGLMNDLQEFGEAA